MNHSVADVTLFRSAKDHEAFQKVLREANARIPMEVFSYCVMTNHWHLVVRPAHDGDLTKFMQWMTLTHVQRWRAAHNNVGSGPLYRGRFKAFAIEEDLHLQTVLRYVERNPLRANIVTKAEDWRWNSLSAGLNGSLEERAILSKWPIERPANWAKLVNTPQTTDEEAAMKVCISRSKPYGTLPWQQSTAKALGVLSSLSSIGRPKKQ